MPEHERADRRIGGEQRDRGALDEPAERPTSARTAGTMYSASWLSPNHKYVRSDGEDADAERPRAPHTSGGSGPRRWRPDSA